MSLFTFIKKLFQTKQRLNNKYKFNLYNPAHLKIAIDYINSICDETGYFEDKDIVKTLSNIFSQYDITFDINDYVSVRGEYFRRLFLSKYPEMNVQNSYPRLMQNKKQIRERDEKGRFKKKGTV